MCTVQDLDKDVMRPKYVWKETLERTIYIRISLSLLCTVCIQIARALYGAVWFHECVKIL